MTIDATILGARVEPERAVLTCMDDNGNVSELVIEPQLAVLPDEALLTWKVTNAD